VVVPTKHFSAYAGALALGFIAIPLILRTTEEVLVLVPNSYREAAMALGIPRWKTIVHIILRTATKGLITGVLLATGRIAGETAPLLFTSFGNQFWNTDPSQPIAAMPQLIFTYAIMPYDEAHRQAWAGALVLIILVFILSASVRIFSGGRKRA
jgi:phosphate transport system permease protein